MKRTALVVSATLMATVLTLTSAPAIAQVENAPTTEGAQTAASTPSAPPTGTTQVPVGERDQVLGSGWRQSADLAWTVTGDAAGLRLLVSRAAQGYAWDSVATLSEPGFTADSWIGNACLTSSSRYVAVTYAPRTFTNKPDLNQRGAFTAVVDLTSGAVKKLGVGSSLAYFSPSCGDADSVVFTQDGAEKLGKTRLLGVDAARGTVTSRVTVSGQVTSAVKTRHGLVAAIPGALVRVEADGALTALAPTSQTAFNVRVVGDGDVAYLDWAGSDASLHRLSAAQVRSGVRQKTAPPALAQGALTESGMARGVGNVAVTGSMKQLRPLGKGLQALPVPVGTEVSTTGALTWGAPMPSRAPSEALADPTIEARPIVIDTVARATAKPIRFVVTPESRRSTAELEPSPVLGSSAATSGKQAHPGASVAPLGSPTNPVENERTCSVARNDPNNQAMQPKPRQVEWAVNQAVRDVLTVQRPANWKNLGMPAYTPQGLFPPIPLVGGGKVPAQVYLGVLAQESNLWMAPGSVVPGVTGNPLIGNYYGLELYNSDPDDNWTIDWADADCGYGVSQTTDGMRLAGKERPGDVPALPYQTQRAVALDFAANVASGLRILQAKWNQTRGAGLIINDGDSSKIENWFYAVWAYNSGFHPQSGAAANNGAWGVGWSNNPANPSYPPNRLPFLDNGYVDATNPQFWPYPEKVMGWAAYPVEVLESPGTPVAGYRQAWWNGDGATSQVNRSNVKPPVNQFCDVTNNCYPGTSNVGPIGNAGPCAHRDYGGQLDMKCWYNKPSTWKHDCSYSCGNEFIRFVPGYAYQEDGTAYPPNCTLSGLPAGALIIDDQPSTYQSVRPGCTRPHTNQGNFQFTFNSDANGMYPGKIDLWQLGAGFNGHFYYTHTRTAELRGNSMKTVGTWTLNRQLNQWARVFVHIPDHGAHTQQAVYTINLGNGTRTRVMLQRIRANRWVSLGVFPFSGTPKVSLSSVTADGDDGIRPVENEDIAWDAVAFQPLAAKPKAIVVSLGDSYSSGEGASAPGGVDYYPETDNNGNNPLARNACHRSVHAWSRKATLAGATTTIGQRHDTWDATLEHSLIACSGAQTENLLPFSTTLANPKPTNAFGESGQGQYGEVSQLDKGFLDRDTTLVTLSIGGNDARFGDVLKKCIMLLTDVCQNSTLGDDTKPLSLAVPEAINGKVKSSIITVLYQIRLKAPNAQVLLMGYPRLFEGSGGCVLGIGSEEAPWLNSMADLLATAMAEAVASANQAAGRQFAWFSDPRTAFSGMGVCGNPENINGIVLGSSGTPGEPSSEPVSQQSFHPKIAGTTNYANSMNATLRLMGL